MARKRHLSRIAVMQVLFERDHRATFDADSALVRAGKELQSVGDMDEEFAESLLQGVVRHEDDIKSSVQEHAPQWSLDRMDPIARCVLLVGCYEILYGNDAPPAVAMNEAIDIAKEYGNEESGKFVNGVLNAIAHRK